MDYPKTMNIFHRIKNRVVRDKGFPLGRTDLFFDCPILPETKQYAHSFCQDGFTICITNQIEMLDVAQIAGILWHEFGKLISGAQKDNKADNAIRKYFRIRVCYDNTLHLWYI